MYSATSRTVAMTSTPVNSPKPPPWQLSHFGVHKANNFHTNNASPILTHPVTSPGGTTIAALLILKTAGFCGIFMRAVEAAWRRSQELSRKN
ncbi:MAG: hypothetical protein HQL75_05115 [Magnetococcales bacterium]|nr:hypothetical protein [Magnetococcales bacterium]